MKKTLKMMATLAALLAMLGFVSCSSDDDDDDDGSNPGQKTTAESGSTAGTTDSGNAGSTDGGSATTGGETTSVTASWDFSTNSWNLENSDPKDTGKLSDFALAATSGSGATLSATGRWWFQNSRIQTNKSTSATLSGITEWLKDEKAGKYLTLNLDASAKVTVVFCGAGSADEHRFVALLDSSNNVLWSQDNLGSSNVTKDATLTAGTYKIASNGSGIKSITCE